MAWKLHTAFSSSNTGGWIVFLSLQKEKELPLRGVGSSQKMAAVGEMIAEVPSFILNMCSYG